MSKQLEQNIASKIKGINKIKIEISKDENTTGNEEEDSLSAKKQTLNALINKLFADNFIIIDGFNPEEFFINASVEQIDKCIERLKEIYNHIPLDSSINEFKNDLKEMFEIYTERKADLESIREKCLVLINDHKAEGDRPAPGVEPIHFDNNNLPSPYWWNADDRRGNPGFDPYNFYATDLPKDDFDFINEEYGKRTPKGIDHHFSKEEDPLSYLIETYNYVCDLIRKNNEWFAMAFDILPNRQEIKDPFGNNGQDIGYQYSFSEENYWDKDQTYWLEYWKR